MTTDQQINISLTRVFMVTVLHKVLIFTRLDLNCHFIRGTHYMDI